MFAVVNVNVVTVQMNKIAVSVTVVAMCILHSQKLKECNFQAFKVFLYKLQNFVLVKSQGMRDGI